MTALAPSPAALAANLPASSVESSPSHGRSKTHAAAPPSSHGAARASEVPTPVKRRNLGEWNLEKTIGAGSMGKVKLARHHITGEQVRRTSSGWLADHKD